MKKFLSDVAVVSHKYKVKENFFPQILYEKAARKKKSPWNLQTVQLGLEAKLYEKFTLHNE